MAGTGFKDMDTGMTLGTKKAIGIRTRDTRMCVPGGFSVPVSNTNQEMKSPLRHIECC